MEVITYVLKVVLKLLKKTKWFPKSQIETNVLPFNDKFEPTIVVHVFS